MLALGASLTALAFALGTGPTPPAKPLAEAIHDALAAPPPSKASARSIQLTDHLLEGANLASGGGAAAAGSLSSPLVTGASGRLWIAKDGRVRLELQAEKGDTQILYDGHTCSMYDAATNTLYRYTPPAARRRSADDRLAPGASGAHARSPAVAKIEEAISHLSEHADVSGATPTDIAGQAAYTVRVSPKEGGSLLGGAELSWDAVHGVPLRAAIYSSTSSLAGDRTGRHRSLLRPGVESSVFEFTPPASAKIEEIALPDTARRAPGPRRLTVARHARRTGRAGSELTTHGDGLATIGR